MTTAAASRPADAEPADASRPSPLRAWLSALRPATLTVGAVPVVVGSAVAAGEGGFALMPALLSLAGALLLQIGCNLVNDVEDFTRGADTAERLGAPRAAQRGWLTPQALRRGAGLTFALAVAVGAALTWHAGWPVFAIGVAGLLAAYAYTAGPWPLGYLGLGDVLVLVFFGPVAVVGAAYVQLGHAPAAAWWAAAPIGALATAVLVVNNLRDRVGDARAGKRTLAVRFGAKAARVQYLSLLAIALLTPLAALATGVVGALGLLPLLTLPLAWRCARALWTEDGAALNPWLGATARLQLAFAALWALALAAR